MLIKCINMVQRGMLWHRSPAFLANPGTTAQQPDLGRWGLSQKWQPGQVSPRKKPSIMWSLLKYQDTGKLGQNTSIPGTCLNFFSSFFFFQFPWVYRRISSAFVDSLATMMRAFKASCYPKTFMGFCSGTCTHKSKIKLQDVLCGAFC